MGMGEKHCLELSNSPQTQTQTKFAPLNKLTYATLNWHHIAQANNFCSNKTLA
jgi:hypothetical protein